METKARYVLVGFCSLLAIVLAMGLLMFSLKGGDDATVSYYSIEFVGSVAGLSVGNDVRFNGIKVGAVRSFTINPNDPSRVKVVISVDNKTPIRQDSEASLSLQGITGLAVIDITGGSASSPRLPQGHKDDMPAIVSKRSTLDSMIAEAPYLLHQANELLTRSSNLLSQENQDNFAQTMASLAALTATLEQQSKSTEIIIANLATASDKMNKVLDATDRVIGTELSQGIATFSNSFKRFDAMLVELEPGAIRLTSGTADELMRVLNEAQALLRNMNYLVNSLNSNPQRFFFGDNIKGIDIK